MKGRTTLQNEEMIDYVIPNFRISEAHQSTGRAEVRLANLGNQRRDCLVSLSLVRLLSLL